METSSPFKVKLKYQTVVRPNPLPHRDKRPFPTFEQYFHNLKENGCKTTENTPQQNYRLIHCVGEQ